ncbi:MAG: circularly permuted type 2 ATP-grasp protein, partial [Solirubrobacterales bacterium]|nr:circularly permuted type 2 ATP-grasp protein [Solirubrobacterales bacterium]
MPDHYDEAITAEGEMRPAYAALLEALGRVDLGELEVAVQRRLADHDVTFGGRRGQTFLDPIPRLIAGAEWAGLVRGMRQRSRALNAFLADVAGGRRIVAEGVVPAAAIELAEHHQPVLRGVEALGGHAPLVGFDFVRGADGVLRVLEDNLRSPSGLAYALAARAAADAAFEERPE